jgi:hypothetical protein
MIRPKKRFVMLFIPLAVILLASLLAAQGPPNPCANICWHAYLNAVSECHGDAACLAVAHEEAKACIEGCHLQPPR